MSVEPFHKERVTIGLEQFDAREADGVGPHWAVRGKNAPQRLRHIPAWMYLKNCALLLVELVHPVQDQQMFLLLRQQQGVTEFRLNLDDHDLRLIANTCNTDGTDADLQFIVIHWMQALLFPSA